MKGLRILVVEDSLLVAEIIVELLQMAGIEVVGPVGRLDPAIALAQHEQLDGALLDVNLAGENSGPIAEVLCARGIPFIFLTGYNDPAALPPQFRTAPLLVKPFRESDLEREVTARFGAVAG
ncbi:MAG: response regulator [Rhodospirillales bacterium]|nr:response regulator [Rhodospirillales bacterium]